MIWACACSMGNFLDKYPTFVCYTKKQRDRMNARFRYLSEKAKLYGDEDRQSIVNRLGRSHFCICMTLAAIRKAEAQCTDKTVVVSDADFDLAMTFILLFHEHVLRLSTRLRKNDSYLPSSDRASFPRVAAAVPDGRSGLAFHLARTARTECFASYKGVGRTWINLPYISG